ncbi:MAG: hypothetical protein AMJ38_01105 [Dehalococcoidia bacterium DG_22]|nr:MAG: hypothetical protein AMJ38_01105 [Dehalococcoidia bacterium DG_22]
MYIAFFALAGLTLLAGLAVVTMKNLLRSALALVVAFVGVAGIYLLLQAEFIAAVQVLLYVGAVMVLILFAIMLTSRLTDRQLRQFTGRWWLAASLALLLFIVLAMVIAPAIPGISFPLEASWRELPGASMPQDPIASLGEQLMTTYLLPFEVASVLLLVALVGAIVVAWPVRDRLPAVEEMERKVAEAKKRVEAAEEAEGAEWSAEDAEGSAEEAE